MRFEISFLFKTFMAKVASELRWFVALVFNMHANCALIFVLSITCLAVVEAFILEEFFSNWKNSRFNKGRLRKSRIFNTRIQSVFPSTPS